MYVIVVGCGRVGSDLAARLSRGGHDVTVIDYVGSSVQATWIPPTAAARSRRSRSGKACSRRPASGDADALAAVTNSDPVNAVVAQVARAIYKVPIVVARNYDPRWRPLHEAIGAREREHDGLGFAAHRGDHREPEAARRLLRRQRRNRGLRAGRAGAVGRAPAGDARRAASRARWSSVARSGRASDPGRDARAGGRGHPPRRAARVRARKCSRSACTTRRPDDVRA